ncbi:HD domain-containing protein [Desulfovibrio litoralis]|uniref:Poly(A) polymerase n=1 Tax=Desulfovibrio litoralis DSM 11393 TaxID=1121455 RepID=A0A1M7SDJ1_9BACT|nr:HD domain-containing protein [Desulfovibrio litoralis]SHN56560.1 poly(A) polymerase [Desulfovibrio litoralis DSM 11393]
MNSAYKEALSIAKILMRNGFDAYVVNAKLQSEILEASEENGIMPAVDIACKASFDDLKPLFSSLNSSFDLGVVGVLESNNVQITFYSLNSADSANPENLFIWITPGMLKRMQQAGMANVGLSRGCTPISQNEFEGFNDFSSGFVSIVGLPEQTIKRDYLLGLRALRYAANYELPIEPLTWMAILRSAQDLLDYTSPNDFIKEWRLVEPKKMWKFAQLLFDAHILHGIIPEVSALSRVMQTRNDSSDATENVFDHTIACMKHYPQGEWEDDWLGTFAVFFHDVGKLYTADYFRGLWTFYQHHTVGAQIVRSILKRLNIPADESAAICHLVKHHIAFSFTLTDRGLRKFNQIDDNKRIMAMYQADIKSRDGSYTAYNHNIKYLEKALNPESMNEPLLNGNEIMDFSGFEPGKEIGEIRDALLKAQISGEVKSIPDAVDFVMALVKSIKEKKK